MHLDSLKADDRSVTTRVGSPALHLSIADVRFTWSMPKVSDAYLAARAREADDLRAKVDSRQRSLPDIRSRLLAARATPRPTVPAPAAGSRPPSPV